MGSYSTNWHGTGPTLRCSGNVNVSVSGLRISVSASGNSNRVYSSGYYGYSVYVYISIDGHNVGSMSFAGIGGSGSCSGYLDVGAGDHNVSLHYCCGQTGGCGKGFGDVTVYSEGVHVNDPYSAPGYDLWSVTTIGRVAVTNYSVNYKINGGTNALDWVICRAYGSDAYMHVDFSKNKGDSLWGNIQLRYGAGFKDGRSYEIAVRFSDSHAEYETGRKTVYTYQEPKLDNSLSIQTNPQNANTSNKFTISGTNNRKWSSYENEFQTRYRIKRGSDAYTGWTNLGNITSWSRTAAEMRSLVPKAYDGKDITLQMERYSPSADWESDNKPTVTFKVYYKPRKGVTCANTSYRKNNSSGSGISKDGFVELNNSLSHIYVSWSYDTSTSDAGYTQGYRIRLYNSSNTVVKTYYTTGKSYQIPKGDIPIGQHTYIDITPYYGNDQSNLADPNKAGNYWYYATPEKCNFVVVASKLSKPVITYPIEGSEWINTKFRVCFQLPTDPDKSSISGTYTYDDIEISVNGKIYSVASNSPGKSSGVVQATSIWSSTNLTYQRKMIVAPFKGAGFPNATTYQIKVRVKKQYTSDKTNWSDWSAVRTFKVKTASFTPNRGDIIYAGHYNNIKKVIDRVRNTYGVTWTTKPGDVARGTKILRNQYPYANLYDRIVATKKQVNNYGTFDSGHTDVRFDNTNAIKENFTQYIELVTAASNEDKSDASGRNYMKIVYDRCNRLI